MKIAIKLLFLISAHISFSQVTDTGYNVGIGTTTPSDRLEVVGDITLQGSNATNDGPLRALKFFNSYVSSNSILAQIQARRGQSSHQKGDLAFYVKNGTSLIEALRIASNGRIGIGTSTPTSHFSAGSLINLKSTGNSEIVLDHSDGGTTSDIGILSFERNEDHLAHIRARHDGSTDSAFLSFHAQSSGGSFSNLDSNEKMRIASNGNVGIGTTNPESLLHIKHSASTDYGLKIHSNTWLDNSKALIEFATSGSENVHGAYIGAIRIPGGSGKSDIIFGTNSSNPAIDSIEERMRITNNGNIGIGTTDTKGFKLGVQGKIAAEEVKVATYTNWADFVFKSDYKLPSLKEVEQHIKENGHLKDIPSAEEVAKNGFFLGEMNSKLLQKIEELMLYTINQEKRIETLEAKNEKLMSLVEKLLKTKIEE